MNYPVQIPGQKKARDLGYWVVYTVCASSKHTGDREKNAFFDEIDGLGGREGGGGFRKELS